MSAPVLEMTIDERDVATIVLQRPKEANALDQELADALLDAVRRIRDAGTVRLIVLRAQGRFFCAGGDVKAMVSADDREAMLTKLAGTVHDSLALLDTIAIPVVAVVQGPAAGGGLGLVLAADYVLSSDAAFYATAYTGVGLSPDCGVSTLLPRAVGMRRALRLLLEGDRIDAATAVDWGLIDRAVPADELDAAAEELVARFADGPYPALGQARRLVRASYNRSYAEHLDDEARTIAATGVTEAATERLAKFG